MATPELCRLHISMSERQDQTRKEKIYSQFETENLWSFVSTRFNIANYLVVMTIIVEIEQKMDLEVQIVTIILEFCKYDWGGWQDAVLSLPGDWRALLVYFITNVPII